MTTKTHTQAADWTALATATRPCEPAGTGPGGLCTTCNGTGEKPWFPSLRVECDHVVTLGHSAEVHITMCSLCQGLGRVTAPYSLDLLLEVAEAAGFEWVGSSGADRAFLWNISRVSYGQRKDPSPVHALLRAVQAADPDAGLSKHLTAEEMRRKMGRRA
jgi:hypothetical protein